MMAEAWGASGWAIWRALWTRPESLLMLGVLCILSLHAERVGSGRLTWRGAAGAVALAVLTWPALVCGPLVAA